MVDLEKRESDNRRRCDGRLQSILPESGYRYRNSVLIDSLLSSVGRAYTRGPVVRPHFNNRKFFEHQILSQGGIDIVDAVRTVMVQVDTIHGPGWLAKYEHQHMLMIPLSRRDWLNLWHVVLDNGLGPTFRNQYFRVAVG